MKYIREFDGLRGLLALWVLFAHLIEAGPFWAWTRHAHANFAVDIFIILSGFVIFNLLSQNEKFGAFLARRFFRLFPVFAVCVLLALVVRDGLRIDDETLFGISSETAVMPHLIAHATMLHGAVPDQILPHSAEAILPPAWSISVEWQFYLLAPFLFAFAVRPGWKTGGVLLGLLGVRVLHDAGLLGLLIPGTPAEVSFGFNAFLPLKLELFAAGALSFYLWRWLAQRERPIALPVAPIALVAAALVFVVTRRPALTLWCAGFGLLLDATFARRQMLSQMVQAILLRPVTRFLGAISYCVYLAHIPVIAFVRYGIERMALNLSEPAFAAGLALGSVALTIPLAWLLHIAIERPFIEFGKRVTRTAPSRVGSTLMPTG